MDQFTIFNGADKTFRFQREVDGILTSCCLVRVSVRANPMLMYAPCVLNYFRVVFSLCSLSMDGPVHCI